MTIKRDASMLWKPIELTAREFEESLGLNQLLPLYESEIDLVVPSSKLQTS